MARVCAVLLAVALIAAPAACAGDLDGRYRLTMESTEGGSVTAPGEGTSTHYEGDVVELVAAPDQGYRFAGWTGDTDTVDDVDAPETTILMNNDCTITAMFEPLPALTVSSTTGGSVSAPGEGDFDYESDTVVELVAVADECYEFVNWTANAVADPDSAATTVRVEIGTPMSVTANFQLISYDLKIGRTAGGSVALPGEGTFGYDCGTVVELVAAPDEGYRFVRWTGDVDTVEDVKATATATTIQRGQSITARFVAPTVATGIWHTLGVRFDGTVVAVGWNPDGQCGVGDWTDIIQVAGGEHHTAGLKADGTVVSVGGNPDGQRDVGAWRDIVQIDAGRYHTVGLRSDGTVVATGPPPGSSNYYGQCDVGDWTDIVQAAAGFYHTIGLRSDGTVVAAGFGGQGRLEVDGWTGIVQVAGGGHQTVGLKADGTVLAVGRNNYGECNVGGWTDVVQVAAGCQVTVGLRSDGTVVAVGWNQYGQANVSGWTNIAQVAAGMGHTVGLRADGSVVAVGSNSAGRCNVGGWMLR